MTLRADTSATPALTVKNVDGTTKTMAKQTIRVCFSIEALGIMPSATLERRGDGYETPTYWMVKWDGNFGFTPYAKCYIAKAPNGETSQ